MEASSSVDRALAALAGRQHGRVALRQIEALGLKRSAVTRRAANGRLQRVGHGVYAVGHRVETADGRYMAAVLGCGPDAVLSHRSAADHWGFRHCTRASVEVTVPGRHGRRQLGIDVHRSRTLRKPDVTTLRGIPCTSVARTLVDLGDVLDRRALELAVEGAERLRRFDGRRLSAVLERANGRRGAAAFRAILAAYEEPPLTERELERRFLQLCRRVGIRQPATQVPFTLEGGDVAVADFVWPDHGIVVETDGRETHGTRQAFERDRRRDRQLMMLGWRVARFTWLDLEQRPDEVGRTILALLERPRRRDR